MNTHKTKIPTKIISLILAQIFLTANLVYPETLPPHNKYLDHNINRLNIAHIPNNEANKASLRKPLDCINDYYRESQGVLDFISKLEKASITEKRIRQLLTESFFRGAIKEPDRFADSLLNLFLKKGESVLILGPLDSPITFFLPALGLHVIAVEIDKGYVENANRLIPDIKHLYDAAGGSLQYIQGNAIGFDTKSDKFDVVMALNLLDAPDFGGSPESLTHKLARVAKEEGGRIVVSCISWSREAGDLFPIIRALRRDYVETSTNFFQGSYYGPLGEESQYSSIFMSLPPLRKLLDYEKVPFALDEMAVRDKDALIALLNSNDARLVNSTMSVIEQLHIIEAIPALKDLLTRLRYSHKTIVRKNAQRIIVKLEMRVHAIKRMLAKKAAVKMSIEATVTNQALRKIVDETMPSIELRHYADDIIISKRIENNLSQQGIENKKRTIEIPYDCTAVDFNQWYITTNGHMVLEVAFDGGVWVIDTQLQELANKNKLIVPDWFISQYVYKAEVYYAIVPAFVDRRKLSERIKKAQLELTTGHEPESSPTVKQILPSNRKVEKDL